MKLWCDPFGYVSGEVKGGTIGLNYHRLTITSNYRPEDIWEEKTLLDAIYRRITVWEF